MKRFTLFISALLSLVFGGATVALADSNTVTIHWEDYALSGSELATDSVVYICYKDNDGKYWFINGGGRYGAEAVRNTTGIPFTVTKSGSTYQFAAPVTNSGTLKGNKLGFAANENCVYIDRENGNWVSTNVCNWTITNTTGKFYTLYSSAKRSNIGFDGEKFTTASVTSVNFLFITEYSYNRAIKDSQKTGQSKIDVTGLIKNPNFLRNYYDVWTWGNIQGSDYDAISFNKNYTSDPTLGYAYLEYYGTFGAVQINSERSVSQDITGLLPGTYTVEAQAFTTSSANAYLYATGTTTSTAYAPVLTEDEKSIYDGRVSVHSQNANSNYYRANAAAAEFLASGGTGTADKYVTNEDYKKITLSVKVGQDGKLTIGMAKTSCDGNDDLAFFDNIRLYYNGNEEFGIDAYNTVPSQIDEHAYVYEQQFNLARDFNFTETSTEGSWEMLVLPVNLTVTQLKNAFGDGCQLTKLYDLVDGGTSLSEVRFDNVDLTNGNDVAVYAGECYLIKVTKAPDYARNHEDYSFSNANYNADITYSCPIYFIPGVTRNYKLATLIANNGGTYSKGVVTKTYESGLQFTGYFFRPDCAPKGSYVVVKNKMYNLTGDWHSLTGTCWYLEAPAGQNAMQLSIDGNGGTTGIITTAVDTKFIDNDNIYDLQGRRVSTPAKGIYIKGGKKYIVK